MVGKLFLYFHTLKDLKPAQIKYQLLGKIKPKRAHGFPGETKTKKARWVSRGNQAENGPWGGREGRAGHCGHFSILIPELDLDGGYLRRFDLDGLMGGQVCLLHEKHRLDLGLWEAKGASPLWNYNLHYLEFLVPLAARYHEKRGEADYQTWKAYVKSWMGGTSGYRYEPYAISMRIPNLLASMGLLGERLMRDAGFYSLLDKSLYGQYVYLMQNMEYKLLANHYFENLKAIVVGSVYFKDKRNFRKHYGLLLQEIKEQVLPDGFHFELSPMYHRGILEGVMRVYVSLNNCGMGGHAKRLEGAIKSMAETMCSFEKGTDRIPLFNDSGENVAKPASSLKRAAERLLRCEISSGKAHFPDAGYAKLYSGEYGIVFDAGKLGPKYMSGHGHCDALSFELYKSGKPAIVNSGTLLYQGDKRKHFRATEAHSTVMVDGRQQSQLWGEHRAARKLRGVRLDVGEGYAKGAFTSYLGDRFTRRITWNSGTQLEVADMANAGDNGLHTARVFYHIGPGFRIEGTCGPHRVYVRELETGDRCMEFIMPYDAEFKIHEGRSDICSYSEEFGKLDYIQVLEVTKRFRIRTSIKVTINMLGRTDRDGHSGLGKVDSEKSIDNGKGQLYRDTG